MQQVIKILQYTNLTSAERVQGSTIDQKNSHCFWTTWSVTEAPYRRNDRLSFLFGVSGSVPAIVTIFILGLASAPSKLQVPGMVLLLGLIINTGLSVLIKKVIRSPRPAHPAAKYSITHGMPSSHSQFVCFFITYLLLNAGCTQSLSVFGDHDPTKSESLLNISFHVKDSLTSGNLQLSNPPDVCLLGLKFILGAAGAVVSIGRVYNGHHTVAQVMMGSLLGICMGYACRMTEMQLFLTILAKRYVLPTALLCTSWVQWIV